MTFHKRIKFALTCLLIAAIGFMEYSIIDDSATGSEFSAIQLLKKDKNSQELVIARNLNMDDDDDDGLIRYTEHAFYHCDLLALTQLHFVTIHGLHSFYSSLRGKIIPEDNLYKQINSYRI